MKREIEDERRLGAPSPFLARFTETSNSEYDGAEIYSKRVGKKTKGQKQPRCPVLSNSFQLSRDAPDRHSDGDYPSKKHG